MKKVIVLLLLLIYQFSFAKNETERKTIHVFVALCDNLNQGIVPVPAKLGNGQCTKSNLYWDTLYGVRGYFKRIKDWILVSTALNPEPNILERILFKHNKTNTFCLLMHTTVSTLNKQQ